jgi:hypothetical protein
MIVKHLQYISAKRLTNSNDGTVTLCLRLIATSKYSIHTIEILRQNLKILEIFVRFLRDYKQYKECN